MYRHNPTPIRCDTLFISNSKTTGEGVLPFSGAQPGWMAARRDLSQGRDQTGQPDKVGAV